MVQQGAVRPTVLPLGNEIDPMQSMFYSSAKQDITIFKDIKTSSDLINYLRSALVNINWTQES